MGRLEALGAVPAPGEVVPQAGEVRGEGVDVDVPHLLRGDAVVQREQVERTGGHQWVCPSSAKSKIARSVLP